jgi:uncharacterized protein YjaZ
MIFEGLATTFEEEAIRDNDIKTSNHFLSEMKKRNDTENGRILDILRPQLPNKDYNYHQIFFDGCKKLDIPRWSGYSVGYYLVKKYLKQNNKKASDIFADKYDDFKK